MSDRERYAYLWNRTKSGQRRQILQRTPSMSSAVLSTVRHDARVKGLSETREIVREVGGKFLNVVYHFQPQTGGDATAELDHVVINSRDWRVLIKELKEGANRAQFGVQDSQMTCVEIT